MRQVLGNLACNLIVPLKRTFTVTCMSCQVADRYVLTVPVTPLSPPKLLHRRPNAIGDYVHNRQPAHNRPVPYRERTPPAHSGGVRSGGPGAFALARGSPHFARERLGRFAFFAVLPAPHVTS